MKTSAVSKHSSPTIRFLCSLSTPEGGRETCCMQGCLNQSWNQESNVAPSFGKFPVENWGIY